MAPKLVTEQKTLRVFAPAKINLFLHVTGREKNGYHTLQSLVCFADVGDIIEIEPSESFNFRVQGPFAQQFEKEENKPEIDSANMVVKAARAISQATDRKLNTTITLTKNLPLAAGIGGGSSDAAATLWGLQQLWDLDTKAQYLLPLMLKLGADVPVCMGCAPTLVEGIGNKLTPLSMTPEIPVLLVNPRVHCPTENVFLNHRSEYQKKISIPNQFTHQNELVDFLKTTQNDLFPAASALIPDIENVMHTLEIQSGVLLHRMTGSGASCFALFDTIENATLAKNNILQDNPDWWAECGWLNRPERY